MYITRSRGLYVKDLDIELDKTISSVQPSDKIPRDVRPITKQKTRSKLESDGAQIFSTLLFLGNSLHRTFYNHWLLPINAFLIFLKVETNEEEVETETLLIYKFVFLTKASMVLNGRYNVHLLIHIAKAVRKWGLLWAYSAFSFEGVGGMLKNLFHRSKHVAKQIFEKFLVLGRLRDFSKYYICN